MKSNKTKLYAKALAEIILRSSASDQKVIDNFVKLLVKAGLEHKAKEILALAEDFVLAKKGHRKIIFETARKVLPNQKKLLEGVARKGDVIQEKINQELIAGIKIIINDSEQFDASMQSKLQKINI